MSKTYRRTMISCAVVAVIAGSVYAALTIAAAAEGPGSSLAWSWRLNNILLLIIVVPALIAAQMWLTHCAVTASDDRIAAAVTVEVVGHLEGRMTKVAEQAATAGRKQLVDMLRRELRELSEEIQAALAGAKMHGAAESLMFEAQTRMRDAANGNVSTIHTRRSE
jgi:hypothetical protein